jgi:hypothetical protein
MLGVITMIPGPAVLSLRSPDEEANETAALCSMCNSSIAVHRARAVSTAYQLAPRRAGIIILYICRLF